MKIILCMSGIRILDNAEVIFIRTTHSAVVYQVIRFLKRDRRKTEGRHYVTEGLSIVVLVWLCIFIYILSVRTLFSYSTGIGDFRFLRSPN